MQLDRHEFNIRAMLLEPEAAAPHVTTHTGSRRSESGGGHR
jgi:hypothetical protein